jgi:hypothetical protein
MVAPTSAGACPRCWRASAPVFVTELMGQGVNMVTGDYSRGAAGFWVENGAVQYPVAEITIAGNLREMFEGIAAVGDDIDTRGGIRVGSICSEMTIAGDEEDRMTAVNILPTSAQMMPAVTPPMSAARNCTGVGNERVHEREDDGDDDVGHDAAQNAQDRRERRNGVQPLRKGAVLRGPESPTPPRAGWVPGS